MRRAGPWSARYRCPPPQSLDDPAGHVDVSDDLHAADGTSIVRPHASQAAYRRAWRISSPSSSGNSSMICSAVRPAARCLSTSDTGIRSPRMHGWPPHTSGSTVIRERPASMCAILPDVRIHGKSGTRHPSKVPRPEGRRNARRRIQSARVGVHQKAARILGQEIEHHPMVRRRADRGARRGPPRVRALFTQPGSSPSTVQVDNQITMKQKRWIETQGAHSWQRERRLRSPVRL